MQTIQTALRSLARALCVRAAPSHKTGPSARGVSVSAGTNLLYAS